MRTWNKIDLGAEELRITHRERMGKGGEVYNGGRRAGRDGPGEFLFGLMGSAVFLGIVSVFMRYGTTLDCGTLMLPPHGVTEPYYSPPELIQLLRECELSKPNEYWMRSSIIPYREGPCQFSHYREIYPPPECKRGEEAKMVMWGRNEWKGAPPNMARSWNITARTLCCSKPQPQKDLENDTQLSGGGTA